MHLDRAHTDVQLVGDEFVGQALDHTLHDLALALGQALDQLGQALLALLAVQLLRRALQGLLNPVHQRVVRKGFFAKVERAALDGIDRRGHIGMTGQKNHRQSGQATFVDQAIKQGQAADAGHAHVEQQATSLTRQLGHLVQPQVLDQALGTVKALGLQTARAQQPSQRLAHAFIVVDHIDQGFLNRLHGQDCGRAGTAGLCAGSWGARAKLK